MRAAAERPSSRQECASPGDKVERGRGGVDRSGCGEPQGSCFFSAWMGASAGCRGEERWDLAYLTRSLMT